MHSSRYRAYAECADEQGAEILGIFERDELGTTHAVGLLLRTDSGPYVVCDATLAPGAYHAEIHTGNSYPTFHAAKVAFARHLANSFAPSPVWVAA
jgi:hypothetical protein